MAIHTTRYATLGYATICRRSQEIKHIIVSPQACSLKWKLPSSGTACRPLPVTEGTGSAHCVHADPKKNTKKPNVHGTRWSRSARVLHCHTLLTPLILSRPMTVTGILQSPLCVQVKKKKTMGRKAFPPGPRSATSGPRLVRGGPAGAAVAPPAACPQCAPCKSRKRRQVRTSKNSGTCALGCLGRDPVVPQGTPLRMVVSKSVARKEIILRSNSPWGPSLWPCHGGGGAEKKS